MDADTSTSGLTPVAVVRSPFVDKFGVPRQAGLVPHAVAEVEFLAPFDQPAMVDGLAGFSHIWLLFRFHECVGAGWRQRVRPPRLGGNRQVGVWASRAPFRPNFIGLSAVRLLQVETEPRVLLRVAGADLVDATPVLDIKPYVPYADAIKDAVGGYAQMPPARRSPVRFSRAAAGYLAGLDHAAETEALIVDVLALDPRPAYRQGAEPGRVYGIRLLDLDVRWIAAADGIEVVELLPCPAA